eukprot:12725669-Heterocapsa_arctica.AAC.1
MSGRKLRGHACSKLPVSRSRKRAPPHIIGRCEIYLSSRRASSSVIMLILPRQQVHARRMSRRRRLWFMLTIGGLFTVGNSIDAAPVA